MDFTNKTISFSHAFIRFSQAVGLAMLVAAYPGASANAGGKIFKTTDSQGNVTFTDVPLLLEPQLQRGLQNLEKLMSVQQPKQSPPKLCGSTTALKNQHCPDKPD